MCRISGIINPSYAFENAVMQVEKMCQLQKHGGPDDEGIYANKEKNIVLGHRRLSLLDLTTAGHQPMHYEERFTITYNGELYNYQSLKETLITFGYSFKTNTDTEVILAAFAKWNTSAFAKFNGMFAFALLDNTCNKIYLVRDAAGIKPLYFASPNDALVFASEIRAFSIFENLQEQNKNVPIFQMAYGFLPEPITMLQHVKPLQKGCFLQYDLQTRKTSLQLINFFSFTNRIQNNKDAVEQVYTDINNAVKSQMVSDAPIGVFLSGGLDSSIIALLAKDAAKNNLHTLSINFEDSNFSEKKYQDLVAEKLQSKHHSILLSEKDFQDNFNTILNDMDNPSCDGINTWFISKYAAQEGLKAVLSGIGADELFGGYPSFTRINKAIAIQNIPNYFLNKSSKILNKKYERISYLQMEGMRGLYLFLRGHFAPNEIAKQIGGYEKDVFEVLETESTSPNINVANSNKASWMEFNYYMQDQLLRDADVMSMAHGLEIRVPFLDNHVINTSFSITENIKYDATVKKHLLIKAFGNKLPREIWDRPKMGFSIPFGDWLKNSEVVTKLSFDKNTATQLAYKKFMQGDLHWSKIMSLVVLQHKNYLN
jgi:asparagine synthase (glutamine-hydrolysing)